MKTNFLTLLFVIFSTSLFGQSVYNNLFLKALADEKLEDASYWLGKGANIDVIDSDGLSPLFYAIANDNRNLAQWLINKGANVNIRDNSGFTNIMGAAKTGNLRMCYLLYSKGADLKLKTNYGITAQKYAEDEGYLRVAKFLKNPNSYSEDPTCWEYLVQSNTFSENGEQNQAIDFAEKALLNARTELKTNHFLNAIILNNLALLYNKQLNFQKAEQLYLAALEIMKTDSTDKELYSTILYNLSDIYLNTGEFKNGEPLLLESMRTKKDILGEEHPDYIACLVNLGATYKGLGDYGNAEFYSLEATRLYKKTLGDNHPLYALSVNNLGEIYQVMGKYEQAESFMKDAIRIGGLTPDENNEFLALALNNLAQLNILMCRYSKADSLIKMALLIDKSIFGENHPTYGRDLHTLAQIFQALGQYERAEYILTEVMQIDKAHYEDNQASYGRDLTTLAQIYNEEGQYEEAEILLKEAIRIYKEFYGENNPEYAIVLNTLSMLYKDMGRYEDAEPLMKEVIRIEKASLGENNPSYSITLSNMAVLYEEMGEYKQAELLLVEAIQIAKKSFGENHTSTAGFMMNLAGVYQDIGQNEKAESLMKDAIQIEKVTLGEYHPSFGRSLNNLAMFYMETKRYEQVEPLMNRVISIDNASLGKNNPDHQRDKHNLALSYQAMGLSAKASLLMDESFTLMKNNLRNNSGYLSETELSKFQESVISYLRIYQSSNYQQIISEINSGYFALDIELFQKGLLLNSVIETRKRILNSGDTSLTNSYQTMMTYRKQADKLYSLPKEQRYEDPVLLESKANDLEKDLKLRSKEYSRSQEDVEITWRQVQDKLKPGEAVVEFASFPYYNKQWTDSTLYCALVLRKQDTIPHMVYLFEEKQLAEALPKPDNSSDATINNTYAVLRGTQLVPDSSWYQGKTLYNLVWKPLDSLLSGIKTVNYACSGLLNTVSFAAIPDATGKLLCDKYALNQYSSTRNLAIETKELPITDATIYGGIQYELDTTLMIANSRQYSRSDSIALAYNSTRSGKNRGNGFDELEGTREEANAINILFREKRITTNNYTGATANEESFKAMASMKSPSVIHLSTHGFYYPDTVTQRNWPNELQFIGSDLNRFQYSPDPLLRSGIVLAGANQVWRGELVPDGVEDGILTAKDVSQLNLSNTQLVVLSACQTGLGDVKGSEGVFGLQRAFKMAGARYLMMSLWSVPDKETKEFMEKFYSNWLSGTQIRVAFQTTQQEMRLEYPKDPYKWAAFVLVE